MLGGLEIPVQVIVKMDYSPQNEDAIFKYESLLDADRQMRLKSMNQLQKQSQNTRLNMIVVQYLVNDIHDLFNHVI